MRFLCAIRIVCWRVSVFYVAAVSAIPADGVPCGGRVLHGHLLALPPRCLVGWRGCFGRLPTPPLVYFPAPSPQPPSPPGKGEIFCFLMQGASPLAFPALDRLRHLQNLLSKYQAGACPRRHLLSPPRGRGPSQTPKFLSPGPPSPWLAALPMERRFYRFCGNPWVQPQGTCTARSISAAGGLMLGMQGAEPLA